MLTNKTCFYINKTLKYYILSKPIIQNIGSFSIRLEFNQSILIYDFSNVTINIYS